MRKNSKPKPDKPETGFKFALKNKQSGTYWDGKTRRVYRGSTNSWWKPTFIETLPAWSESTTYTKWKNYEIERRCGNISGNKIPKLELIKYQLAPQFVEADMKKLDISEAQLMYEFLKRSKDLTIISEAFGRIWIDEQQKASEYKYVVARKGGSFKETIQQQLPDSRGYSFYTFIKTEADLVYLRLLLGKHYKTFIDLEQIYKTLREDSPESVLPVVISELVSTE